MKTKDIAHTFQNGGRSDNECLKMSVEYLRKNKDSLSLRGIERQLKMPDTTLVKAVNGSQKLAKHWEEPLNNFLNNLKNCKCGSKKK